MSIVDCGVYDLTYGTVLADRAARHGERLYLRFEEQRFTYLDAHHISNRVANGLAALGVKRGEHIALFMDNCPEIVWYYFGIGKLGAVSAPLNTAAKGQLLVRYLRQARATCLVIDAQYLDRLDDVVEHYPDLKQCIVVHGDAAAGGKRASALPVTMHHDVVSADDADPGVAVSFKDTAYLSFTSGTSGPSKASLATHAHTYLMAGAIARAFSYDANEVMYTCLPLFHGNAMRSLFVAQMAGCSIALARRFSASAFWDDIRRYGATQFNLLGAIANILWSRPESAADRDHTARKCMIVPVPSFAEQFCERFNVKIHSTYALTDYGYLSFLTPDDPPEKRRSAGRAQPDVDIAILDDDDNAQPSGQTGEICVRNRRPWIAAQGYYGMPEETIRAWRNLWFHTGDRGYLDEDGYLFFVDRKKDAIRRRGENISSFEVEQIILKNPAVLDVAAFAMASEMSEDEVMVSVVLREDRVLTEEILVRWCAEHMAYFMVPRYVQFLPELPRTLTEKVEKYRLRAEAEKNLASVWDREKHGITIAR